MGSRRSGQFGPLDGSRGHGPPDVGNDRFLLPGGPAFRLPLDANAPDVPAVGDVRRPRQPMAFDSHGARLRLGGYRWSHGACGDRGGPSVAPVPGVSGIGMAVRIGVPVPQLLHLRSAGRAPDRRSHVSGDHHHNHRPLYRSVHWRINRRIRRLLLRVHTAITAIRYSVVFHLFG